MNSPKALVPPEVAGKGRSRGPIAAGFAPRFFVALLLGLVWLVPAWWVPQLVRAMILWDLLAVAAFVFDLVRLAKPAEWEGRRSWEHAPALATRSEVVLTVRNFGNVAARCALTDETPVSFRSAPPTLSAIVPARQQVQLRYAIMPGQRGDVQMGQLFLRYQSQLGFAERWAAVEISQTIRVLPDLEQARKQALYLIRSRQVDMEKRRRRQRGQGREFDSLREYRQGDELRDVSWTATARRHQLTTRIFEVERSQAVWIVLDAGRLLRAEVRQEGNDLRLAKLDYAVNAALSLAQVATQCGDRVGLLAYGRNVQQNLGTGRGPAHLRNIVDSLAQVRGEAAEANHAKAVRMLLSTQSRRSLVVWLTDFAETPSTPEVIEYAMQMRQKHLVVFAAMNQPDLAAVAEKVPETQEEMYRHAAALEIAGRREVLLRGLRQRGVFAFELLPGLLASSIVNQYLDIKERNLL